MHSTTSRASVCRHLVGVVIPVVRGFFFTSDKGGGIPYTFLPVFVCLSVCSSVCKITQKGVRGFG